MEKAFGNEEWATPINIKDNINKIKNKDMEYLFGKMVMYIKEIFQMTCEMVTVKCIGLMENFIKVNGLIINKQAEMNNLLMKLNSFNSRT